jgi:hypothetical protein
LRLIIFTEKKAATTCRVSGVELLNLSNDTDMVLQQSPPMHQVAQREFMFNACQFDQYKKRKQIVLVRTIVLV